jgi:hypothetical protein
LQGFLLQVDPGGLIERSDFARISRRFALFRPTVRLVPAEFRIAGEGERARTRLTVPL